MKSFTRPLLIAAAVAGLLTGCATSQGAPPAPQLTFAHYAPVTLNAASVQVTESYKTQNDPDNVAGQFVLPPAEAVKRYVQQRFKTGMASGGLFEVILEDARLHMRQIDQQNRVLEWSGIGKEDEYRLMMQVSVVSQPDGFKGRQSTTIKMDRTLVMPSSVTLAERELRQTRFLEQLIADLDKRITEAMDQTPAIRQ